MILYLSYLSNKTGLHQYLNKVEGGPKGPIYSFQVQLPLNLPYYNLTEITSPN